MYANTLYSLINYNKDLFQNLLTNSNWNLFYNARNPSIAWSILHEIIENVIDNMCPQKQFNIKKIRDPWITDELLEIPFEKDRLLLKAKHSQKVEDWTTAKIARNEANILIRNSKSDFIQNNLELHRNDAKKLLEKSKCYSTPKKQ